MTTPKTASKTTVSAGTLDNLLSRLDQGAAYEGYPEGFGFSWPKLAGDAATVIRLLRAATAQCDVLTATEPAAWRYKCQDGSVVLMLKRLSEEQKRRGYYTGEDGEDDVEGDEAVVGPFHWAEETPLFASSVPSADKGCCE